MRSADGRVVSGVGGQYNFVAMAHALPEARSILCLRSTRTSDGVTSSNVIWSYGHCTVPRHLRDIVVTEYGIADLRGRTDREIVEALVGIMDARFPARVCFRRAARRQIAERLAYSGSRRAPTPHNSWRRNSRPGVSAVCLLNCRSARTSPPKRSCSRRRCARCRHRLDRGRVAYGH